jgi:uncharacterized RDD family membrane protein YckC
VTDQPDPYAPPPAGGSPPSQPPYAQPAYGEPAWGGPPAGSGDYASWGRRLGGYLLDVLIMLPFYVVIGIGAGLGSGAGNALRVIGYLGAIGFVVWNQIIRQGRSGQSLGKEWVGIRLLRESDGQPIGPGMTFVRAIAHIIDAIPCYLGFLWPLWDKKRQTFADKICGTVVVR